MATYQGERFLSQQLQSIAAQSHVHWRLFVSDDGSRDATDQMLEAQQREWGSDRLVMFPGPNRGHHENFRSLTGRAGIDADLFAYADQDDIWEPDKLERAVRWMAHHPASRPLLYCSRTRLIDTDGREFGLSPLFRRPPSFANALVQSLAGGNTMVFNRAARNVLREALPASAQVVTHDWWTYLLVTGAGGEVHYDPDPTVRYRQHASNSVGANLGVRARVRSTWHVGRGRLKRWNDSHVDALTRIGHLLTPENRTTLAQFSDARRAPLVARLAGLKRSGVYRQRVRGDAALFLAALLNRV